MTPKDIKRLRKYLRDAEIQKIFDEVFPALEGVETEVTSFFLANSARFKSLENDRVMGTLSVADSKLEFNKIVANLDKSIQRLSELPPDKFNSAKSIEEVIVDIEELSQEFLSLESMDSELCKMRMRVTLAREIADKLIIWPNLMDHYRETDNIAVICGIGRKVKLIPDLDDLEILESLAEKVEEDFIKQFIVNALAELIIAGQLRVGDEDRMKKMLKDMEVGADKLLEENIERVKAMVKFVQKELEKDSGMRYMQHKKE